MPYYNNTFRLNVYSLGKITRLANVHCNRAAKKMRHIVANGFGTVMFYFCIFLSLFSLQVWHHPPARLYPLRPQFLNQSPAAPLPRATAKTRALGPSRRVSADVPFPFVDQKDKTKATKGKYIQCSWVLQLYLTKGKLSSISHSAAQFLMLTLEVPRNHLNGHLQVYFIFAFGCFALMG